MSWRATGLPKMREQTVRALVASADRVDGLLAVGRAAEISALPEDAGLSAEAYAWGAQTVREQARLLRHADCWWVTSQMTQVALQASGDLPEWTPAAVMPDRAGLLAWESGLPLVPWSGAPDAAWETDSFGRRTPPLVSPHAVRWSWTQADSMTISVATRTALLPESAKGRLGREAPLLEVIEMRLPPEEPAKTGPDNPVWASGLLHCLGATWLLSQQPTVADQTRLQADRDDARALRRAGVPGEVRLVDLRRLADRTTDDGDGPTGSTRSLRNRHLVRGHWRQQPYGPRGTQRRPTWIPPYLQGPSDAPLIEHERVMIWRR